MNKIVDELDMKLKKISFNELDNIIDRISNMKITKKKDNDIINLINSMDSLKIIPDNKKLDITLEGVKKVKRKSFARKYKSLSGKKTNLSNKQIEDIFSTMNALKTQQPTYTVDDFDWGDDDINMNGGKKKKNKKKKKRKN